MKTKGSQSLKIVSPFLAALMAFLLVFSTLFVAPQESEAAALKWGKHTLEKGVTGKVVVTHSDIVNLFVQDKSKKLVRKTILKKGEYLVYNSINIDNGKYLRLKSGYVNFDTFFKKYVALPKDLKTKLGKMYPTVQAKGPTVKTGIKWGKVTIKRGDVIGKIQLDTLGASYEKFNSDNSVSPSGQWLDGGEYLVTAVRTSDVELKYYQINGSNIYIIFNKVGMKYIPLPSNLKAQMNKLYPIKKPTTPATPKPTTPDTFTSAQAIEVVKDNGYSGDMMAYSTFRIKQNAHLVRVDLTTGTKKLYIDAFLVVNGNIVQIGGPGRSYDQSLAWAKTYNGNGLPNTTSGGQPYSPSAAAIITVRLLMDVYGKDALEYDYSMMNVGEFGEGRIVIKVDPKSDLNRDGDPNNDVDMLFFYKNVYVDYYLSGKYTSEDEFFDMGSTYQP